MSGTPSTLTWVNREGDEKAIPAEVRSYLSVELSPDGRRVAFVSNEAGRPDVWIYDLTRDTPTQFTRHVANDVTVIWTLPDGERLLWSSDRYGPNDILSRAADGTGDIDRLTETPEGIWPLSITPDGKTVLFAKAGADVGSLPLDSLEPTILLDDDFLYSHALISPDGNWLVYGSDEEGQEEIFVRPFPNVDDERRKVSQDGGFAPRWGPNGDEIFYQSYQGEDQASGTVTLMSVRIDTDPTLVPGTPSPLFAVWTTAPPLPDWFCSSKTTAQRHPLRCIPGWRERRGSSPS